MELYPAIPGLMNWGREASNALLMRKRLISFKSWSSDLAPIVNEGAR